jgi:hypothetical protein
MAVKDALLDFAAAVPNRPLKSYKDRASNHTIEVGYLLDNGHPGPSIKVPAAPGAGPVSRALFMCVVALLTSR